MYIAIDPGPEPGWCKLNNRGDVLDLGIIRELDHFPAWLEEIPTQALIAVIYEEYKQLPHRLAAVLGRKKNKIPTVKCIGHLESWCLRHGIRMIPQSPQILPATQKHTQVFLPSDHANSHHIAAYLHGARYLIDEGIMKTALEMSLEETNKRDSRLNESR